MNKLYLYRRQIMEELILANKPNKTVKDILIVVHNQLDYVKKCIDSIVENTDNYKLCVWDNASDDETKEYLQQLLDERVIWGLHRSETNEGFIKPNNVMFEWTKNPYVILLNSDCEVKKGWDQALLNYLAQNEDCRLVGYCGSKIDQDGQGRRAAFGSDVDFICGWCLCLSRDMVDGKLFDEDTLEFAYCEDSDLSFRIREKGWKIYSLHADLVVHHGNKTIVDVHKELGNYLKGTFDRNHAYIRNRWSKFLPN